MPASIFGNELALKFGRHRAINAVMFSSAAVALLIGFFADKSPWLLLTLVGGLCVHGSSGLRRADLRHDDGRRSTLSRRDDGAAFDRWFQPVRPRRLEYWRRAGPCWGAGKCDRLDGCIFCFGRGRFAWPGRALLVQNESAASMSQRQLPIIHALGTTQTLAWASSYYLPAILADPIARDLGVSSNWIARLPWRQDLRTRLILAVYASQLALGQM